MSTFPRQVQAYYERRFRQLDRKRREKLEAAISGGRVAEYVTRCRRSIRDLYPLPAAGTPLKTTVTGALRHSGYRIEKLHFESRPGFIVTANLYVPDGEGPFPCVLGACGHSELGKAEEKYQHFCAGLALKGFLVLVYDPIGQGERIQFGESKSEIGGCVAEHVTIGTKLSLTGDYFGSWRAWDGVRALDVLLDRPEADPRRVGMTGNSGGGTMTTIITALDDRLTMAAPSCFITTYRHNLENELPSDTEQIPPGIIAAGHEQYDHLISAAPRPTLICTKEDDFFDHRGSVEAFDVLRRVYAELGRVEDVELATGRGGHGFDRNLRESMYAFFIKHARVDASADEPDIEIHRADELFATPEGSVASIGSRTVLDYCREHHTGGDRRGGFSTERLARLLALSELPETPPKYRVLRRRGDRSRIAVESEPAVYAVLSFDEPGSRFRIPDVAEASLFLPHLDADEPSPATNDGASYVLSTRGTGESRYDTASGRDYFDLYDSDYLYSSYGLMMNIPLVGRKVFDVLRTIQLLDRCGTKVTQLAGSGCGALIALYAAPFIDGLKKLVLRRCIPSMRMIVDTEPCLWPQSVLIPGILEWFDLPDIIEHLCADDGVEVRLTEPWDNRFQPTT